VENFRWLQPHQEQKYLPNQLGGAGNSSGESCPSTRLIKTQGLRHQAVGQMQPWLRRR